MLFAEHPVPSNGQYIYPSSAKTIFRNDHVIFKLIPTAIHNKVNRHCRSIVLRFFPIVAQLSSHGISIESIYRIPSRYSRFLESAEKYCSIGNASRSLFSCNIYLNFKTQKELMVIIAYNGLDRNRRMSEGDPKEPGDQTPLTLILALFIYPECFLMKGYENSELSVVDDVKTVASKESHVPKESLVVTFREQILKDEASLKSYGIRSGDTLVVTRSFLENSAPEPKKLTESEIQTLIKTYKGYKRDPKSKAVFEKLTNETFFKKLLDTVPELEDDFSGYALVKNPRLFIQMGNEEVIRRAIECHPWVVEAAWNFMAIVEEERLNMPDVPENTNNNAVSDDDDVESPQVPDHQPGPLTAGERLRDEPVVTATQLAAALAAALGGPSTSRSPPSSPPVSSRPPIFHPTTGGHDFVTPEMFNDAVQRAYANMSARSADGAHPSSRQLEQPPELTREQLAHQMSQMQELGLVDEAVNLRALRITGGDVQGAVDLIFGGLWLGDEGPEVELESMQESE
ncbi:hypothetical protein J437_LFUL004374 [Ladona fulva]|uniref:Ubiquitin-like protein 7 n=1 Tax=Ladona fulva TaxID=123851 RepID=A0A8K0K357_LADFU|nr:hypothetical protein J437_LFUL004374 [Ladona fulva]